MRAICLNEQVEHVGKGLCNVCKTLVAISIRYKENIRVALLESFDSVKLVIKHD